MLTVTIIDFSHFNAHKTEALVNTFNANMACGYDDWELNIAKDISTCKENQIGNTKKTIYYLKNDELLFGDENINLDEEGYSNQFRKLSYTKVIQQRR